MIKIINSFATFFSRQKVLLGAVVATLAAFGVNLISKIMCGFYAMFVIDVVFILCVIFLYIAYQKHNKNVQKGLLGAVLMWNLYDEFNFVVGNMVFTSDLFAQYNKSCEPEYIILCTINVILFGFLFANHFIINSDHHSRPVNIFINQLLVIAIAVITIVSLSFPVVWDNEFSVILEAVSWHIGQVASIMMIASYESVFDAYRINRENNL